MKDLETRFADVERRVRGLVTENRTLAHRVRELERELGQARKETQELQFFHGKKIHIREKLERLLKTLDALGAEKTTEDSKSG